MAIVIAIIGISFVASKGYGSGADAYEFTDITIDEYLELMQSEDKKIVYIARPTCSYCALETPLLKQIASQYDLEVYYLDTTNSLILLLMIILKMVISLLILMKYIVKDMEHKYDNCAKW